MKHTMGLRALAFYLPQFHPIPENDEWWGAGFTDWVNVAKARPRFPGHLQPDLPGELGFYDLRWAAVGKAQAKLARSYGIHGFCYYHYWFHGRRLLNEPLDQVLQTGEPDMPFCLCWANENWTRAWDGNTQAVLMEQTYSTADDFQHMAWLAGVMTDPRYVRVSGRPLFLVYRASNLPEPSVTTETWRQVARHHGLGELYLCRVESSARDRGDPRALGFDAAVEFQPDWPALATPMRRMLWRVAEGLGWPGMMMSYEACASRALAVEDTAYVRYPCVTPSWDNSPRRRAGPALLVGSTPQRYEDWLRWAASKASGMEGRLLFINAWNEWAEGCHLEPCRRHGRSYLEATERALRVGSGHARGLGSLELEH